ncbi:MAG: hypothetical protein DMG05_08310 [Acidobacteria bacterium]|nr:MAG: hypothetical protein DMG05_08310 [Acidobacteriota bacterium]
MANSPIDLPKKHFIDGFQTIADMIFDAVNVQSLFTEIARENDLLQNLQDLNDAFPGGKGCCL